MTDIYEPRCPDCGRFDANCKCDWPMPSSAPTTPPDEAQAQPEVESLSIEPGFPGFDFLSGEDEGLWILVPEHSDENLTRALDYAEWAVDRRYTVAVERWAINHNCPDDCDECTVDHWEEFNRRDEAGEDVDGGPDCWCHAFDGGAVQFVKEPREGAQPAYEIDEASRA